jgi:hypothetical protein
VDQKDRLLGIYVLFGQGPHLARPWLLGAEIKQLQKNNSSGLTVTGGK